ncbi:homoserine dehydrogenase [Virgibacillus dakarensis]|uniref:homoserine dehydrogenase n=1 Tax=Virgibacillus dakarensis TaxID=1917889 RepID=UPI000B43D1F8|nr:homoserine dehydrogenase [Virgibacillus dakarensis]MBT2215220.1 homoserine dehydrogenase [Virgibacillus dakarensis]
MKTLSVAILGFGTVGSGVYETIQRHQNRLQKITGFPISVSAILVEHPEKHQNKAGDAIITADIDKIASNPAIDVVFEAIVGREPAFTYLKHCIEKGKHIITANKEMFAFHGKELTELAARNQVTIGFEATTAGGIPIIQTVKRLLNVNQIDKLQAILNGTSNYILTKMREEKATFSHALKEAQQLGYAEADPTNDIEGYDAFYKLMILSELIFAKQPVWKKVRRTGITGITPEMHIEEAHANRRIKHIAEITFTNDTISASIEPVAIPETHPLYAIDGVSNAIHLQADILGPLTLVGPGAGSLPTASAMIEDFCHIWGHPEVPTSPVAALAFP